MRASVRFDRQLVPNVGVGFGYIYNRHANWYGSYGGGNTVDGVNVGRPYAVWNVPVVLTDPFDGQQVTIYTYPADYPGAAFNQNKRLNAPSDRPDYYHSFEVTVNKRFSRRWNMSSSFWTTKTHEWISANAGESERRSLSSQTIPGAGKLERTATTAFPWDINVNGNLRAASGALGQRTQTFSDARLNQGTVTLRMEPYGAQEGPVVPITSLRVAKKFRVSRAIRCGREFLGVQRDQQQRRGFHFLPQRDVRPNHRHPSTPSCAFRGWNSASRVAAGRRRSGRTMKRRDFGKALAGGVIGAGVAEVCHPLLGKCTTCSQEKYADARWR